MLIDVPDKKLLTIGKRYFQAQVESGQEDEQDSSSEQKVEALKTTGKASLKGQSGVLRFDQSKIIQMQHFEQIDLDKVDEFLTTEDHDDEAHEQSLIANNTQSESPFAVLR